MHYVAGVSVGTAAGGTQPWLGRDWTTGGPPSHTPWASVSSIGFFFEPTVFTDVEDHMFIAKEESFGPIMIISRFANG